MSKSHWVSASDAGRAAFCPHSLEHKFQGSPVSKAAKLAREKGNISHDKLNSKARDSRCFVASHLYGVDDNRTEVLREFRDSSLKSSMSGRCFIVVYYKFSPLLVKLSRKSALVKNLLKMSVDNILLRIQRKKLTVHKN